MAKLKKHLKQEKKGVGWRREKLDKLGGIREIALGILDYHDNSCCIPSALGWIQTYD